MGNGTTFINSAGTGNVIEDLRLLTKKIDDLTNELEVQAASATASWDGAAQEQYRVEKANWDRAIAEMHMQLGGRSNALNNIVDITGQNENRVLSRITGSSTPR